jgi:hypothetical protein
MAGLILASSGQAILGAWAMLVSRVMDDVTAQAIGRVCPTAFCRTFSVDRISAEQASMGALEEPLWAGWLGSPLLVGLLAGVVLLLAWVG